MELFASSSDSSQPPRRWTTVGDRMNATLILWVAGAILLSACASPVEGVRPTSPDSPARTIFVSVDTWHAMIAFPIQQGKRDQPSAFSSEEGTLPQLSALSSQHLYEEWGYAEQAWYLEDQRGLSGIVRALFWPTEGTVEVGHYDRVWADRTPQPPSDLFTFRLTEEGYQRLRRHLRGTISVETPIASAGSSTFYPAARSYHLFHTCHQYAAHALRETGLPISPFGAFNRTSFAWQLRRAVKLIEEQRTEVGGIEPR